MIIFLSGSINAGKETVANILTRELPNTANIKVDAFWKFIHWMYIEDAVPINLENTVSVIKNFSKRGLSSIVRYPLYSQNYEYLTGELSDTNEKIYVFSLIPKLETILSDRGNGAPDAWDKERITHHYSSSLVKPNFGTVIDNSDQTPEETAKIILDYIQSH